MNFSRPLIRLAQKEYNWVNNVINAVEKNRFIRTNIVLRESDIFVQSEHDPKMIKAVLLSDEKVREDDHDADSLDWTFGVSRYVFLTDARVKLCEGNESPNRVYRKRSSWFC